MGPTPAGTVSARLDGSEGSRPSIALILVPPQTLPSFGLQEPPPALGLPLAPAPQPSVPGLPRHPTEALLTTEESLIRSGIPDFVLK